MTTTDHFQVLPDYYTSIKECSTKRQNIQTNPRYRNFRQRHFTVGDEAQFQEFRSMTNGQIYIPEIKMDDNKYKDIDLSEVYTWTKYQNLNSMCVNNTFEYMFNKMKKGIFVKIQNNELKVFLPFSKNNFVNEWGDKIKIDPQFGNMFNFVNHINNMNNRKYYRISITPHKDLWYANNCLLRYEKPIDEGDTNIPNMSDMLRNLCSKRKLPDIEFFINRRDFPVIKRDGTEAYDHIFGDNQPLLSHNYDQYAPILSMVTTKEYADIPIPTGDDWARVSSYEGRFFPKECKTYPKIEDLNINWDDKKPTAVFRGASTGCGVTINTNMRLKLAYLSVTTPPDKDGPLLDAGITKWQLRPRKLKYEKYLQTIDVPAMNDMGIYLVNSLSPLQQSEYKYLVHVDGHVSAFRLSLEMSMGCCILLADSKYKLWFRNMLKPMIHYIPVKSDLSDLIQQIIWCRENDEKCKNIAKNAREFYIEYLQEDGILDYFQKLIIGLKNQSGVYLYNTEKPLERQLRLEQKLNVMYPMTTKTVNDINTIPKQGRSFGLLKGLEWIVNLVNDKSKFSIMAKKGNVVFTNSNNTVVIHQYNLAGFTFIVKSTTDKCKEMENIHETYIGTKAINELVKYIPNFVYVFGKYDDGETKSNVIMENIFGETFSDWLKSNKFNMKDYIFILIQLSMALEVAQRQIGFVHWDLTPWNIMIQTLPEPIDFDYLIDENTVYRIKTRIIPIIIDYGKSHVIYNNEHHGYINMYKMSTVQDIISLLITSLNIITYSNLSDNDIYDSIKLANFLSNTRYRQRMFRKTGANGLSDLNYFFSRAKKYMELISSNKYELEERTPLDFIKYINHNFKYKFTYEKIKYPVFKLDKGNPRQVYEYILSSTQQDRIQSFVRVFERVNTCKFPDSINLFFSYYSAQTLEDNISSVYTLMKKFLANEKITNTEKYDRIYKKTMSKIKKIYSKKLDQIQDENIDYKISDQFEKLEIAPYTDQTFLTPSVILNLLHKNNKSITNLSEYKHIIQRVLLNQGKFKLSEQHKKYYSDNFQKLLRTNSLVMQNNTANITTLYSTSKELYESDKTALVSKLLDLNDNRNYVNSKEYLVTYNKIEELITGEKKLLWIGGWHETVVNRSKLGEYTVAWLPETAEYKSVLDKLQRGGFYFNRDWNTKKFGDKFIDSNNNTIKFQNIAVDQGSESWMRVTGGTFKDIKNIAKNVAACIKNNIVDKGFLFLTMHIDKVYKEDNPNVLEKIKWKKYSLAFKDALQENSIFMIDYFFINNTADSVRVIFQNNADENLRLGNNVIRKRMKAMMDKSGKYFMETSKLISNKKWEEIVRDKIEGRTEK